MYSIHLPLTRGLRRAGPALIFVLGGLVLLCPIAWPWRLGGALTICGYGLWLWRHYLRRRPVRLDAAADGSVHGVLADGSGIELADIRQGIVRPWLISARLLGTAGERCDLLVPRAALSVEGHWRLRRLLLGFRPPAGPRDAADSAN